MLRVIKNQKYQTEKEVERAAKGRRKVAIRSSVRHWRELATAPVKDLLSDGYPRLTLNECALCVRYDINRTKCLLFKKLGNKKCYQKGELYNKARAILNNLKYGESVDKSTRDANIKHFRRIAEKLMNVLISCLER